MIIRDSLTVKANFKNAKFDWTRTAMSPSLLLIPFRILGPTLLSPGDFGLYSLKEISADHRALTTFCRRFFGSLRDAGLTAIKSAFGIESTPLSQKNFGPRKSNLHPTTVRKRVK